MSIIPIRFRVYNDDDTPLDIIERISESLNEIGLTIEYIEGCELEIWEIRELEKVEE